MTEYQRSHSPFLPTYAVLVGLPVLALLVILRTGAAITPTSSHLGSRPNLGVTAVATSAAQAHSASVTDLPLLLAQIVVIVVAARPVGAVVRRRLGLPFAMMVLAARERIRGWVLRLFGRRDGRVWTGP